MLSVRSYRMAIGLKGRGQISEANPPYCFVWRDDAAWDVEVADYH